VCTTVGINEVTAPAVVFVVWMNANIHILSSVTVILNDCQKDMLSSSEVVVPASTCRRYTATAFSSLVNQEVLRIISNGKRSGFKQFAHLAG
jgi:hypothetical protein